MRVGLLLQASALTLVLFGPSYAASVKPVPGSTFQDCADCPEMTVIPKGSFEMGSSPEELARETGKMYENEIRWEQPKHKVTINYEFAIGKFEVTRRQYERFVTETGRQQINCKIYKRDEGTWGIVEANNWADPGHEQTDRHPVACVRWADAEAYANWLSSKTGKKYRLPSEAEWEYVARAGSVSTRFWGDKQSDACKYANVSDNSRKPEVKLKKLSGESFIDCTDGAVWSAPVGSYQPNKFGVYDMIGNLWEWTADCFFDSYQGAPGDGSARTGGDCRYHAFRGAAFSSLAYNYRVTQRAMGADPKAYADDPREYRADYLGFRVARDLK